MNELKTEIDLNLLEEIFSGLSESPKRLPSKLFYDEEGSKLFDQICKLEEYYPTRTELMLMKEKIEEISSVIEPGTLLIEFGSGSSLKTRILLRALKDLAGYIPIDISEEHLLKTAEDLEERFPLLDIYPVASDYTNDIDLPQINSKVARKVAYFPGSTIGNFTNSEAKEFLELVAGLCGSGGGLLIGIDRLKDRNVLFNAYNDSKGITEKFNKNILLHLNNEFGFDFNPDNFDHHAPFNEENSRIEMHLVSLCDQVFSSEGREFEIKEGEYLLTEYSHKYTLENFRLLTEKHFNIENEWTDDKGWFSIFYLSVK